jgi:putative thioredoxin
MSDSNYIFDATLDNFQQGVIENSDKLPVVVDFWADWCQPCKILMPILDKLVREFDGGFVLAKVDSDAQQELSAQYKVRGIPSVKIFRHGEVVEEFTGVQPEEVIRSMIQRHVTTEADELRNQAIALIRQGDMPGGRALLQQAAELDPDNSQIQIDLAHADAGEGDYPSARERLRKLPLVDQEKPEVAALMAKVEFATASEQAEDRQVLLKNIESNPKDSASRYQLAAQCVVEGDYACALEQLLHIVMTDRKYNDDAGRRAMLSIFTMLGDDHELTTQYRRKMFNAMH